MKTFYKLFLSIALCVGVFSPVSSHANPALEAPMKALTETAVVFSKGETASFSATKVAGTNVKEMLESFSKIQGYEIGEDHKIFLSLTATQIADEEPEDYKSYIGLARNVDVYGFAVDLYDDFDSSAAHQARYALARKKALKALFEITNAGAKVGLESAGWNKCGYSMRALIILDVENKVVYSLTPDNQDC
jgi:hypothetical protein